MIKYYIIIIFLTGCFNNAFAQSEDSTLKAAIFLQRAYNLDGYSDTVMFNIDVKYYKEALAIDSLNADANYGLGSLYFNEAVNIGLSYSNIKDTKLQIQAQNKMEKFRNLSRPYLDRYQKYKKE